MLHSVAMIPFANMAPYRQLGPPAGCQWVALTPKQSVLALQKGEVQAAAVPVGALPLLAKDVEPLGAFGIAAARRVRSVLFFSACPWKEMAAPAGIHLSDQSATSVRLLYLLFGYEQGFHSHRIPYLALPGEGAEGFLVIGDDALLQGRKKTSAHVMDLAEAWFAVHGLPFVFARWIIHVDAPHDMKEALLDWLARFQCSEEELILQSAPSEARRLGLELEEMVDYLRGIIRVLGADEIKAQEVFLDELSRYSCEPLFMKKGDINGDKYHPAPSEPSLQSNRMSAASNRISLRRTDEDGL